MKRVFYLLMIAALSTIIFFACKKKDNPTQPPTTEYENRIDFYSDTTDKNLLRNSTENDTINKHSNAQVRLTIANVTDTTDVYYFYIQNKYGDTLRRFGFNIPGKGMKMVELGNLNPGFIGNYHTEFYLFKNSSSILLAKRDLVVIE